VATTPSARGGDETFSDLEMVSSAREQYFDSDLEDRGHLGNTAEQAGIFRSPNPFPAF